MAREKNDPPKSLKVELKQSRRLRPYGSSELRIFEAHDVVELDRNGALSLIGADLADGVDSKVEPAKGRALDEPSPGAVKSTRGRKGVKGGDDGDRDSKSEA